MMKRLKGNKGFSLIELIVVIAILGVLVGVAAPQLIGYIERTRESKDIANLETAKRTAEAFVAANSHKEEFPDDQALTDGANAAIGTVLLTSKDYKDDPITVTVTLEDNGTYTIETTPLISDIGDGTVAGGGEEEDE